MVQPIESEEIFGNATAVQGEAPKHTMEGHERCAFYPAELVEGNEAPKGGFLKGPLVCPHGEEATGAFYSEDYIKELKHIAHLVIDRIDDLRPHHIHKTAPVEKLRELTR